MDADGLYGLPLDRFVAERGALVKSLRANGRRDEAADVAGLRKPSVAAWAVNQLVRAHGPDVESVFRAGDAVRRTQAALVSGRADRRALKAATDEQRAAVDRLVRAAAGLLSSEGHELSPAVVDRVAETLHAAGVDEDARKLVAGGRLARELRHVGLGPGQPGIGAGQPGPAPARARAVPASGDRAGADLVERAAAEAEAGRARAEAERAERERAAAEKAARAAEAAARRRVDGAARALRAAEDRRDLAAQALDEARALVTSARAQADAAAAAQRSARADVERLRVRGET